ncbi:hypothetical protein VPH35_006953 [Triticum aestivum]
MLPLTNPLRPSISACRPSSTLPCDPASRCAAPRQRAPTNQLRLLFLRTGAGGCGESCRYNHPRDQAIVVKL